MIPMLDLNAQYRSIKSEIDAAVAQVFESGHFVLGEEVAAFEREFADFCGAAHAVAVNSGTSALQLALLASGVGAGDEVITVPFTFVATAAVIDYVGAVPVFVDIDPRTFTMNPAAIEDAIGDRTKAIIPVHVFGQTADMDPIRQVAARNGLAVIEDAAQAHGARYRGLRAGVLGDFGCFSFYPTKNLGALGDAGIVTTGDPALAAAAREIREYGWRERYVSARIGINTRLDPVQAAILAVKLPRLDADNRRRQAIAARYDDGLAGLPLVLPPRRAGTSHVFHQYVVRSAERGRLRGHLRAAAIGTGIHYPAPVHLHPAYRERIPVGPTGLENSERAASEILSLPIYPQLADAAVDRVVAEIRRFFR